jgi:hypothetical protein
MPQHTRSVNAIPRLVIGSTIGGMVARSGLTLCGTLAKARTIAARYRVELRSARAREAGELQRYAVEVLAHRAQATG